MAGFFRNSYLPNPIATSDSFRRRADMSAPKGKAGEAIEGRECPLVTPCRRLRCGAARYLKVSQLLIYLNAALVGWQTVKWSIPDAGGLGLDNAPLLTTV